MEDRIPVLEVPRDQDGVRRQMTPMAAVLAMIETGWLTWLSMNHESYPSHYLTERLGGSD